MQIEETESREEQILKEAKLGLSIIEIAQHFNTNQMEIAQFLITQPGFIVLNQPEKDLKYRCPHCGSINTRTRGVEHGLHRWQCLDCNKSSSTRVVKLNPTQCVYCGSNHTKLNGLDYKGRKRHLCKTCGRQYTEATQIKAPLRKACPYCGETNVILCGKNGEIQRYLCKSCNRRFQVDTPRKGIATQLKTCPKCQHVGAYKRGTNARGVQLYRCAECGHVYSEQPVFKQTTKAQQEQMRSMFKRGWSRKDISESMCVSLHTVQRYTVGLNAVQARLDLIKSGKRFEDILRTTDISYNTLRRDASTLITRKRITKEQKEVLFNFGKTFAIPPDLFARFIPCKKALKQKLVNEYAQLDKNN